MAFCPNCGAQNAEGTAACTSCGGALGGEAPKYKGTIMMGGSSPADVEAMVAKARAAVAARAPEPAAQSPNHSDLAFNATMLSPVVPGSTPSYPHPLGDSPVAQQAPTAASAEEPVTMRQSDVPMQFRDSLSDDPAPAKSGKGGLIVALIIAAFLLIGAIATAVYFVVQARTAPQLMQGPFPGAPPGQYPMAPVAAPPGVVPDPVPQMPGVPAPAAPVPPQ